MNILLKNKNNIQIKMFNLIDSFSTIPFEPIIKLYKQRVVITSEEFEIFMI